MGDTSWHLLPFGPSKSTGCWQHSFRLLKKSKRENIKPYTRKILSLLNYGALFLLSSSILRGRISSPDLTPVTEHPAQGAPMCHTYQESEVFMTQSFSVRNLENQGGFWNKFLWFRIFHFPFFSVSPLCIKKHA